MAKTDKIINNVIEDNLDIETETENIVEPIIKFKEEVCKLLWVDIYGFGFDFKGYGLTVKTNKEFDNSHIKDLITVQYESDIGNADFKFNVKYE